MAETAITVQDLVSNNGGYRVQDITWTAADAGNNMSFANIGREFVLLKNDHISTLSVVCTGVADEDGRTGDITIGANADEVSISGYFDPKLWNNASGNVIVTIATDTALFIAVVRDPKEK